MAGSLSSILSIARSALLANQKGVEVTSHNIANANTEGYTRQRPSMVSGPPVLLPEGSLGTGVRVINVDRLRDSLLDVNYREQSALQSGFEQRLRTLSEIEDVLGEPSDHGLAYSLDAFWGAWGDLANNPSDSGARIALRDRATALTDSFHRIEGGLTQAQSNSARRLDGFVGDINHITSKISNLNKQIASTEASGKTAGDLRDQRDLLTDQLAEYMPVHVVERTNGGTGIYAAGLALVDGGFAKSLALTTGPPYGVALSGGGPSISTAGAGKIGASLDILNADIPAFRQQLDDFASELVGAVNTVHQTGTNAAGNTLVNFFDQAGITARSISVSATILADQGAIAAGTPDGTGLYQAGENDVALALGQLRNAPQVGLGGASFGSHYGDFVTDVGLSVSNAESSLRAHDAMRSQAGIRRSEVSGVSIDEEMVELMRFQQAFTAASRLVTTADEMMQTVLSMV